MRTSTALPAPRSTVRLAAVLLVMTLLAALLVPLQNLTTYLVPIGSALPSGARVIGSLPIADALVVSSPSTPVGGVAADTSLTLSSLQPAGDDGVTLDSGVASTGAPTVWADGNRGEGAVVALIDSGVAPVDALLGAVVGEIDFSGTGGGDGYGHGTFMASLIAARGDLAPGVAPEAGILSLKVAESDGTTSLGAVLSAMQWLYGPGRASGVRIATLAMGADPDTDAARLLDTAAQVLADGDVLLVTASGNEGAGNLTSPATSTGTFSVGAYDDQLAATDGIVVPDFSGTGFDRAGVAQPDALASGVAVVGHMDPTSTIATRILATNPTSQQGPQQFRGSGTSMSTALAAGVAALASSARPELGGGALEFALRNEAGVINAVDAVDTIGDAPEPDAIGHVPPGQAKNGNVGRVPPGQAKRGNAGHVPPGQAQRAGERATPAGFRWVGSEWTNVHPNGFRWVGFRWVGFRWVGFRWVAVEWNGEGWGDASWQGAQAGGMEWQGFRWVGFRWVDDRWAGFRWVGFRWVEKDWAGFRWVEQEWAGFRWVDDDWSGFRWFDEDWAGFRWAFLDG